MMAFLNARKIVFLQNRIIGFSIEGNLPALWEDFIPCSEVFPRITLMTKEEAAHSACETGYCAEDNWLNLIVDVRVIDEDVARLALAEALGIDNPEMIAIIEKGLSQTA
ncbi:MAG: hypothetical protein K2X27_08250 [Candidatus Obscuribacterales bacterium]|nr:hypothetical protein [Candidatus Obscuribacterales bacterium]